MIPARPGLPPKAQHREFKERCSWPSRFASRPSCAPTLTAPSRSRGTDPPSTSCWLIWTAKHGGLRDRLVDDGGLRRFVNVYLNDEDVRFLAGLETPVKDGDTVTVLPAVAGGAS